MKTIDHSVYSVSAHDPGGIAEDFQITHEPGAIAPGYFYAHTSPHTVPGSPAGIYTGIRPKKRHTGQPWSRGGLYQPAFTPSHTGTVLYYALRGSQRLSEPF